MKTVAIVLSNYNHGRYLRDSLGHICRQTRPADQIVVIDDGSTDDSVAIIEEMAASHPNLEFHRNERNIGLQASIAKALPLVRCDYLAWAASDDRLLPEFLERNMAVLERHPDAAFSFSETFVLMGDTEETQRFSQNPQIRHIFDLSDLPEYVSPAALRNRMKRAYLPMSSNTVVVRTDLLRAMGGYPAALRWHSDSFTYISLALRHGVCALAEPLALIRANPGSYSTAMHDLARQKPVLQAMLDLLRSPPFSDIRRSICGTPSNFSPFGTPMLMELLRRPKDWDLMLPFLLWRLGEVKTLNNLTWGQLTRHLARQGAQLMRAKLRRA